MPAAPFLRPRPLAAGLLLLLATAAAQAAFVDGLTSDEQSACGLSQLSAPEAGKLNQLIERDERFALEGGVVGFDKTFSARLRPEDFAAAGLSHLTAQQLARLDDLIAFRIAHPPPPQPHFEAKAVHPSDPAATHPGAVATGPSPAAVTPVWHPEIHGDMSFTVGGGHGGSFYGGGMDLSLTDPSGKFTIDAAFYEYHSKGRYFPEFGPPGTGPGTVPIPGIDPMLGLGPGPDGMAAGTLRPLP